MADFDPILRLTRQDYGENPDAWGGQLNSGAITRTGEAFTIVAVTVNADVTLTVENGLADQARRLGFIFSGAGGFTVTHPAIAKPYLLINNCAANITFKPQAGTGATIRAGSQVWYFPSADGLTGYVIDYKLSDLRAASANISLGGNKITNVADPTAPQDAATKNYIDTLAASGDLAIVAGIAAQIVTLADIEDGTVALHSISNLAPAATSIITLAPQAAAIAQLAGMFVVASATDPTTRLNGSPLQAGDYYLNTTGTPAVRVYSGATWIPIAAVTIASQAEAVAGTNNTNVMTPLRTLQSIAANAVNVQVFTANGTWTKPSTAKWVFVEVLGGGGGGGSGRRGAIASNKTGGVPGAGSPVIPRFFAASDLPASVSVTVGAAGVGGAAIAADSTDGNAGTSGGNSSFGSFVISNGGLGGLGGSSATSLSGVAGTGWYGISNGTASAKGTAFDASIAPVNTTADVSTLYAGAAGAAVSAGIGVSDGHSSVFSGAGGGAGGSESSGNTLINGGAGGLNGSYTKGGGGTAGVSSAGSPTAGGNGGRLSGGGGGGASQTVAAAAGGNGGIGAGGGGGGSSRNGFNSGKGGDGGRGEVRVWWI